MKSLVAGFKVVVGAVFIVLMGGTNIARAADSAAQAQAKSLRDQAQADQDRVAGLVFQKSGLGTRIEIIRLTRRKSEIARQIADLVSKMQKAGSDAARSADQAKIVRLQKESALLDELMALLPRLVPTIQQKQKDHIAGLKAQIKAKRDAIRTLRREDPPRPAAASTKPVARPGKNTPAPDPEIKPLQDQMKDLNSQIKVLQDHIKLLRAQERSSRAKH